MLHQYTDRKLGSIIGLTDDIRVQKANFDITNRVVQLFWNRGRDTVSFLVDDTSINLEPNQLVTITFFQHVQFPETASALTAFVFNREFYCMADYDKEVGCYGILFFGAQDIPVITIPPAELVQFDALYQVFRDEFSNCDNIQAEMLRMLLKRLVIKCTALAKTQRIVHTLDNSQIEIIRKFNFLVDVNYKTKKQVQEYADMLFKSPKTLSNLFAIYNQKSPLQVIHERIILEAKRMVYFTDKNVKEIAFELGFDDPAALSRLFKRITGETISNYKEKHPLQLEQNKPE